MYKKTVLKDLLNYADTSIEFRKRLQTDAIVKREIRPNMIDTVKPIYEFDPDDMKGIDNTKFEGEKKEPKKSSKKEKVSDFGKRRKEYYATLQVSGIDKDKMDKWVKKHYKVKSKNELSSKQINEIFSKIEKRIADRKMGEEIEKEFDESQEGNNE